VAMQFQACSGATRAILGVAGTLMAISSVSIQGATLFSLRRRLPPGERHLQDRLCADPRRDAARY
jgi:hypothetical protein